jgi:hypothetical protein
MINGLRTVYDGNGVDTTATVLAALKQDKPLYLATLYLIGEPDDPDAVWITDWEAALNWKLWGTFLPGVTKRGKVGTKVGLEVTTFDFTWSPANQVITNSMATASPYQRVLNRMFDNQPFRAWTVYMPTKGDANTYGCSEFFGGWIKSASLYRGQIQFKVNSFLDVVNQLVPANTIELYSTLAGYTGATPPTGVATIPQFAVIQSTETTLVLDCTSPSAHHIFADNKLRDGYLVFNYGGGATLGGIWSPIASNETIVISSVNYNKVRLFSPLPFAATPGTDTCFVSAAAPMTPDDGAPDTFPYVPAPETAL